jgi:membrane-bound ClpP family serine protease
MTPSTMRLIGILFIVAGAVMMFLNLKRFTDLGTFWVGIPLFVIGLVFLARSRRATL